MGQMPMSPEQNLTKEPLTSRAKGVFSSQAFKKNNKQKAKDFDMLNASKKPYLRASKAISGKAGLEPLPKTE